MENLLLFNSFNQKEDSYRSSPSEFTSRSEISEQDQQFKNNLILKLEEKRVYTKRTDQKVLRWTNQECLLYEYFIEKYQKIMKDSGSKRNTKIFQLMSKFIGKTPSQCRSHHQKFYKKIIQNLDRQTNIIDEDKNQIKDLMKQKMNQKDISEKLENLERLAHKDEIMQKAVFIQKMQNSNEKQDHIELEMKNNLCNIQQFKFQDINLTPYIQPQANKITDIDLEFRLDFKEDDYQNVSWKNVFNKIEKVENSINFLLNIMQNDSN